MMGAEKLAMKRRIDTLDQYATRLHAALTEAERENARLKAELETVKRERDAAVADLELYAMCPACKCFDVRCPMKDDCLYGTKGRFAWRGLCGENGGIEA